MPDREHGDEIDRLVASLDSAAAVRDFRLAVAGALALASRAEADGLRAEVGRLGAEVSRLRGLLETRKVGTGIELP